MKTILLTSLAVFLSLTLLGQEVDRVKIFIREGVALHDKGDFEGAIAKYDKALDLDEGNADALYEKSFSLLSLKKYDACISICEELIQGDTEPQTLKLVYTTYGNALDGAGKPEEAIEAYDEGLEKFPTYYHLHYNKGITFSQLNRFKDALPSFEKAAAFNPEHASSHNAIARIQTMEKNNIPSLLAFCRFIVLEPQGGRVVANFPYLEKLMGAGVEKTGDKSITITLDNNQLSDPDSKEKVANDFGPVYTILSLKSAMDFDKKNKKKSQRELFLGKFESICSVMKETQEGNFGFYWEHYAPYFIDMNEQNWLEVFSYLVYANSDDPKVGKWLDKNYDKIEAFYEWNSKYEWNLD